MNQSCINSFQQLNNSYFWKELLKTKILQRHKSLGKRVRDRKISLKQYNEITSKFIDIFYNELYYLNRPSYFFLGGFIENVRTRPGVKTIGRGKGEERRKVMVEFPMSLSWTDLFFLNKKETQIRYIKLKGSTNQSNKIEKDWLKNNNYYDLREL